MLKMISGIYYIKNLKNNKYYIGQTTNIYKRKQQHFSKLRANKHINQYLQYAFNKYGEDAFEFKLIKACKPQYLNRFEKMYIRLYNAYNDGYNLTKGGDTSPSIDKYIAQKISNNTKGSQNHFFGKHHNINSMVLMSQSHNTTSYFRVSKEKGNYKNGFRWRYQYYDENGHKRALKSVDINKLKKKVLKLGLPWRKI